MNEVKYKVTLVTTRGCESCAIARNNIKEAINQHSKKIEFNELTKEEFGLDRLKRLKVKDFPFILFSTDDIVRFTRVGTSPIVLFLRWFDIWFK